MKFGYNWPIGLEEKWFEIVDGRRRRTTESAHTVSSLGAFGSGELKRKERKERKKEKTYNNFVRKNSQSTVSITLSFLTCLIVHMSYKGSLCTLI